MKIRPIYLSTMKRIMELNHCLDQSLDHAYLNRFVFELSYTDNAAQLRRNLHNWCNAHPGTINIFESRNEERDYLEIHPSCDVQSLQTLSDSDAWKRFVKQLNKKYRSSLKPVWALGDRELNFNDSPLLMGILNVTPDSFSDGGQFLNTNKAVDHALKMVEEGAEIIDIGGESTRPGAEKITVEEELERVIPVIGELREQSRIFISIDTYKARVASQAIKEGADIVNDISGGRFDSGMISVIEQHRCPFIAMHIKGTPKNMQKEPHYEDVVFEIYQYFEERIEALWDACDGRIILDPGIGFGKRFEDNLKLLRDLQDFTLLGQPLLVGTSRKSFIGQILQNEVDERLCGSLGTFAWSVLHGADLIRVHDVRAARDAISMVNAIKNV